MDAALCAPLPVGPTAGVTTCPKAAVTEAAANVANKRKSCRRTPVATSLSCLSRHLSDSVTAIAVRLKGGCGHRSPFARRAPAPAAAPALFRLGIDESERHRRMRLASRGDGFLAPIKQPIGNVQMLGT